MSTEPALTPASFAILLSLAAGEKHGYGIMREIAESQFGGIRVGAGTLYRTIKQLRAADLIDESGERAEAGSDERRRYYRLSRRGRKAVQAEAQRLAELVGTAANRGLIRGLASR